MRKFLLAVCAAMVSCVPVFSQETVKNLYAGEAFNVTWDNTLKIDAAEFNGVNVGNYIYVTFDRTTDVIELKADGKWLPGSLFTNLGDNTTDYKCYLTEAGLAAVKQYGLEICGADFTVSKVSVMNVGFVMPAGAIWGGYFWVENWNTMDLRKTAFDSYAGQKYLVINFSDDKGDFTNYDLNVMTAWNNDDAKWPVTKETHCAVVDLQNVNVASSLADVDNLIIQANPGEGNAPFNITSVVLSDNSTTNIEVLTDDAVETLVNVYNIHGMMVRSNVSDEDATVSLPAGIYIVNGKKVAVR